MYKKKEDSCSSQFGGAKSRQPDTGFLVGPVVDGGIRRGSPVIQEAGRAVGQKLGFCFWRDYY